MARAGSVKTRAPDPAVGWAAKRDRRGPPPRRAAPEGPERSGGPASARVAARRGGPRRERRPPHVGVRSEQRHREAMAIAATMRSSSRKCCWHIEGVDMDGGNSRPEAIQTKLGAIFVSLELSRSTWVVTSLLPGGEKMSKHSVRAGDVAGLFERFGKLRGKARTRTGEVYPFVVIQEAGLDGFWIHRVLEREGVESHVVDAASIATFRPSLNPRFRRLCSGCAWQPRSRLERTSTAKHSGVHRREVRISESGSVARQTDYV